MRVSGNLRFSHDSLRRCSPVKFMGMAMSRISSMSAAEGPASCTKESWPGSVSALSGATIALVMPLMRVTGMSSDSAWNAS